MREVQFISASDHIAFSKDPHKPIKVNVWLEDRGRAATTPRVTIISTWYEITLSSWLEAYRFDNLQPAWEMFSRGD